MNAKPLQHGICAGNHQRLACTTSRFKTTLFLSRKGKALLLHPLPERILPAICASSGNVSAGTTDYEQDRQPKDGTPLQRLREWISGSPWDWRKLFAVTAAAAVELYCTGRLSGLQCSHRC